MSQVLEGHNSVGKKKRMRVLVHLYPVVKVLLIFLLSAKVKDNLKDLVNL